VTTPTAAVVRQARELLADETHWTQGAYARDAFDKAGDWGHWVAPCDEGAVRWCMVGAIAKCAGVIDLAGVESIAVDLTDTAIRAGLLSAPNSVLDVNDHNIHREVLGYMANLADALEREEAVNA
jgi:hypothetical protein